ncbi:MAG TPA: hypothetical protein VGM86_18865 [Thermoanaerobaculia bacterium]|jgi:hypothetical protein
MSQRTQAVLRSAVLALLAAVLSAPAQGAQGHHPSQTTVHETLTATVEVIAVDPVKRHLTLRGPLGGEIIGVVDKAVKNLAQVKVGDMVSISYHSSIAMSASKPGEPNPLFTGGEASTAEEGKHPEASVSEQTKHTVTVVSVDPEKRSVVLQEDKTGELFPVEVERPEIARKLQTLQPGDKIDVVTTEAVIVKVTPAAHGAKPGMTYTASTLIVERGVVVRRLGNTIVVRDERGRQVKVTVDPKFRFMLDGREVTVSQLQPGTKLTRTALRTEKVEYE